MRSLSAIFEAMLSEHTGWRGPELDPDFPAWRKYQPRGNALRFADDESDGDQRILRIYAAWFPAGIARRRGRAVAYGLGSRLTT